MDWTMKIGGQIGFADKGESPIDKLIAGLEVLPDTSYLIEEKLDGWYGVVIKDSEGIRWQADWVRYGALQALLPILNEFMPEDSVLICEVGYGTNAETTWAREHGYHRIIIFDTPKWAGKDLTSYGAETRFELLKFHWGHSKYAGTLDPQIDLVYNHRVDGKKDFQVIRDMFLNVVQKGGEGLVIKKADSKYIFGRSKEQWKLKKYLTKDFVIMGFSQTVASTYLAQGMTVASISTGLYINGELKTIGAVSGFSFDMRKAFSDRPQDFIGKVCEIGGFEIFKSGAMRHSMFLRMREDRTPEECTLEN